MNKCNISKLPQINVQHNVTNGPQWNSWNYSKWIKTIIKNTVINHSRLCQDWGWLSAGELQLQKETWTMQTKITLSRLWDHTANKKYLAYTNAIVSHHVSPMPCTALSVQYLKVHIFGGTRSLRVVRRHHDVNLTTPKVKGKALKVRCVYAYVTIIMFLHHK